MSLMNDLKTLRNAPSVTAWDAAYERLRAFIEQHEPWLPPQQEGFGPWIEFREGDKGPHVNDVVHILTRGEQDARRFDHAASMVAKHWGWTGDYVAYCVKLDETP